MSIRYFLISFLLSTVLLFGQNGEQFLIKLSLENETNLNKVENLEIPVYHLIETDLYSVINQTNYDQVKELGLNSKLLKTLADDENIYIIIAKKKSLDDYSGEYVYRDKDFIFIQNPASLENIVAAGFTPVKVGDANYFKNEKSVYLKEESSLIDSTILQLTTEVNADSVEYFIQSLQDFQTRFLFADTRDAVAEWIKNEFIRFGFTDVVVDSFIYQNTWQKNVIATLPGVYQPEVISIVGGHHDSYSSGDPMTYAPGADDNASGTAAVLEMARVLMKENYQPKSTLRFITFGAEEYGLWGSKDYAQKALNEGMNIKFMINHDMISHTYSSVNSSYVDLNYYSGFEYLREIAWDCVLNYTLLEPHYGSQNSSGSDSHSFWYRGFPSIYFEERDFSPFYHSPQDIISNYNMEYCAEVIKASLATFLTHSQSPNSINNYQLKDAGTGTELLLSWSPSPEPMFDSYKIYAGTESGVYTVFQNTTDTAYTLSGLTEGTLYYVGVSVLDTEGNESFIVERSQTPYSLPLPPSGLTASPAMFEINFEWNANKEIDLLGYNLYRSQSAGSLGTKINQQVITDTTFTDDNAQAGIFYYYQVKAVDVDMNESDASDQVRSRIVSLDKGILIVDETKDGDGTLLNPTDEEVDNFYHSILQSFNYSDYDITQEGDVDLAVLGAYSTVIWHGNDFTDLSAPFDSRDAIKDYLDYGGNFLYTGYRPSRAFEQLGSLTGNFGPGDFIYDYLKIDETIVKLISLFNKAEALQNEYSSLFVDSTKTRPADDYHLRNIESLSSNNNAVEIFKYETLKDSTTPQGNMKGLPVGVEYIGNDFKTVIISFPLYYMLNEDAKSFVETVLIDKFNEITDVEETEITPTEFALNQNYPNPFNPTTKISWQSPVSGHQSLTIYDVLGNEVATLVDEYNPAGSYEVEFDASRLTSGIYFYQLRISDVVQTKKMILIK